MKARILITALLIFGTNISFALETIRGRVTIVEPTYLPLVVYFQMDTGNATCPLGTWLKWQNSDAQNNRAVYATLMTALMAGKQVNFIIDDGDSTCTGRYIHLLQ